MESRIFRCAFASLYLYALGRVYCTVFNPPKHKNLKCDSFYKCD